MAERLRLRDGSSDDLPALSRLDSSFSNEWVLWLERHGGPIEQTIELRWRHVKAAGSSRAFEMDVEELTKELQRSDRLVIAEVGGSIAGYLMLGTNWNGTAELADLIVDIAYRRRGLGRPSSRKRRPTPESAGCAPSNGRPRPTTATPSSSPSPRASASPASTTPSTTTEATSGRMHSASAASLSSLPASWTDPQSAAPAAAVRAGVIEWRHRMPGLDRKEREHAA